MPLPLSTTTVDIYRVPGDTPDDGLPDVEPTHQRIARNVPAAFARASGRQAGDQGQRSLLNTRLVIDYHGLNSGDVVVDNNTRQQWDVGWVNRYLNEIADYEVGQVTRREVEVQAGEAHVAG